MRISAIVVGVAGALMLSIPSVAGESVLYTFQGGNDGAGPVSGLIADKAGNLYGTTSAGGGANCVWTNNPFHNQSGGCGTVYRLSRPAQAGGQWTETVLYRFQGGADGAYPNQVIFDSAGNLYGTAIAGGVRNGQCPNFLGIDNGCGTVFQLTPPASKGAGWTFNLLYSFAGGTDGFSPWGPLAADGAGGFFGVTYGGGGNTGGDGNTAGTVFRLTAPAVQGGAWSEAVLYAFKGVTFGRLRGDAESPIDVNLGIDGNLYGESVSGGLCTYDDGFQVCRGAIFQLARGTGGWMESVVGLNAATNTPSTGSAPILVSPGVLYGSDGVEFYRLINTGSGWLKADLYSFNGATNNGSVPNGIVIDKAGHVFGTTQYTGAVSGAGIVFELKPPSSVAGNWTETVLHPFTGGTDGASSVSPVLLSPGGIYGTTVLGGLNTCAPSYPCGTIFEVAP